MKNSAIQNETFLIPEKNKIASLIRTIKEEESETKSEVQTLEKNIKVASKELKIKEENQAKFQKKYRSLFEKRQKVSDTIDKKEDIIDKQNESLRKTEIRLNSITLQREQISSDIISLQEESEKYKGVEINTTKPDPQIKKEITMFEKFITEFGNVNLKAIEMYKAIKTEYDNLINNIKTLSEEREDVIGMIGQIEVKKKELFMTTFDVVNAHFKKFFSTLSSKGDASIVIENPERPFEEGVLVKVKLKGTKYLDIKSLSGGEKTMTALAFIFAIQEFEPASFIIMDEVDAALDKKNSELLSNMVSAYSSRAQFIVISHNEVVITQANTLYGISMDEHSTSKVTTLSLDDDIKKRIEPAAQ